MSQVQLRITIDDALMIGGKTSDEVKSLVLDAWAFTHHRPENVINPNPSGNTESLNPVSKEEFFKTGLIELLRNVVASYTRSQVQADAEITIIKNNKSLRDNILPGVFIDITNV